MATLGTMPLSQLMTPSTSLPLDGPFQSREFEAGLLHLTDVGEIRAEFLSHRVLIARSIANDSTHDASLARLQASTSLDGDRIAMGGACVAVLFFAVLVLSLVAVLQGLALSRMRKSVSVLTAPR